jgi:hypothetical protein
MQLRSTKSHRPEDSEHDLDVEIILNSIATSHQKTLKNAKEKFCFSENIFLCLVFKIIPEFLNDFFYRILAKLRANEVE